MVAVGDKLGGRYFVTRVDGKPSIGACFEVRDAQGEVFFAQQLSETPLVEAGINELSREVASVPRSPSFLLPTEFCQSPSGEPFGIYPGTPLPPLEPELSLLIAGNNSERRAEAQRVLVRAFAALAEEMGKTLGSKGAHGAIEMAQLRVAAKSPDLSIALMGFGIEAAARITAKRARPTAKVDPAALLLILDAALTKAQSQFEGVSLVKWAVVLNCAKGGEHPALANCGSLARFLRELTKEGDTQAKPRGPEATASHQGGAAEALTRPASVISQMPNAFKSAPDSNGIGRMQDWVSTNRRSAMVAGGGVAVLFIAAIAATLSAGSEPSPQTDAPPPPLPIRVLVPPSCPNENSVAPTSFELVGEVSGLAATCTPNDDALHIIGGSGNTLAADQRSSRRGRPFSGTPSVISERFGSLGTAVTTPSGAWVAWRTKDVGRLMVRSLAGLGADLPLPESAWTGSGLQGMTLLSASATDAWVAGSFTSPEGAEAVIVRFAWGEGVAPSTAYHLGRGVIEARVPGDPTLFLVRATEGRRHRLTIISASLTSLPALAGAPTRVDGGTSEFTVREVPEMALHRSQEFVVEADALRVEPFGAAPPNAPRYFLITAGAAADGGLRDGTVSLLMYPVEGEPSAQVLTEHGHGMDMSINTRGFPVALVREDAATWLYTRESIDDMRRETIPIRGIERGHILQCGQESWLTFAAQPNAVGAIPLACVSRHATPSADAGVRR